MLKSSANRWVPIVLWAAFALPSPACGPWLPSRWLDDGGVRVVRSPEFFWEFEVKRIAKEFLPPEKAVAIPEEVAKKASATEPGATPSGEETLTPDLRGLFTAAQDVRDFEAALKDGGLKVGDATKALEQHRAAREVIDHATEGGTAALPAEEASEFADYHRGALAFRLGDYAAARTAWEALLKRPESERPHRTVWAQFMLGKTALRASQPDDAAAAFAKSRELAAHGFADPLGLAAESYGWEAKARLMQEHEPEAARLYLTQLALGDLSAVMSLKHVIPDWTPPEIFDAPAEPANLQPNPDEAAKFEAERAAKQSARMQRAAKDPLLRRLVTAHILATETVFWSQDQPSQRCTDWLAAIQAAGVEKVADAENLGWVAYTVGRYDEAAAWLARSGGGTHAALWLKAKLERRAGKDTQAAASMSQALALMKADEKLEATLESPESDLPWRSASGDMGALHLLRNEFGNALTIFLQGGLWEDASYVAERVLTADELKQYVEQHCPPSSSKAQAVDETDESPAAQLARFHDQLRWLLGRRLVREDRYQEARAFLPAEYMPNAWFSDNPPTHPQSYQTLLDRYQKALAQGADTKLSKKDRARAWFTAACIARLDGMEIMGTEVEPDAFVYGGDFEVTHVAEERLTGQVKQVVWEGDKEKSKTEPVAFAASKEEKKRLAKNTVLPEKRFHYRYVAAGLAWKAAGLLPDQSEELADVLNTAGNWLKSRDETAAQKYFDALERRCSKTAIGNAAVKKHWFVDTPGPWLKEETSIRNRALGIGDTPPDAPKQ